MSLANSLSQAGKMNELASWNGRIFKLWGLKQETCKISTASASRCLFTCECVCFSCRWPGCSNFVFQWRGETHGPVSIFEPASCFNIYVVDVLFYKAHIHTCGHAHPHTHTLCICATWSMVSAFLRRQDGVWKIDLVSDAETERESVHVCVYSVLCVFWSRQLSFILMKTYTELYGFRDTMSDLHLAEHKWVKRKYNAEQSPLLTPQVHTRSYNQPWHCSNCSAYWACRQHTSKSALMVWVIKHYSRWGKKQNQKRSIDLKMSCVISKSFYLYFFSVLVESLRSWLGSL